VAVAVAKGGYEERLHGIERVLSAATFGRGAPGRASSASRTILASHLRGVGGNAIDSRASQANGDTKQ
jgi:hypothetical protein